ncbi:MAG: putative Caspase-1, p20 [Acidobacteria bacterium]|nr:putative Caspase-1, p20 [Acidobacteriota bacterium]
MARRALLVGINRYPNPAHRLRGCVNDVRQMEALLRGPFGFEPGAIVVLRDEAATAGAIRRELGSLVGRSRDGDILVFHYSGHGSQVPDLDGDESDDRLDEVLCPYDLDWSDPLTDDDLGAMAQRMSRRAHLAVVLDCCHSGTGLRDARGGDHPPRGKSVPGPAGVRAAGAASLRRFGERAVAAGAVLLAGCRAGQTSADAYIDGEYHGAHTFFLCRALAARGYEATYQDVTRAMRRALREGGFPQVPQLEGSTAGRSSLAFGGTRAAGAQRGSGPEPARDGQGPGRSAERGRARLSPR